MNDFTFIAGTSSLVASADRFLAAPLRREISQQDFSSVLSRARTDVDKTPEQQAREGAEQFVAIAMIQPLLKQWRESNAAAPPFAPSQGEKQFQSLFDGQIAQQIARASRFPLVERVAEQLLLRAKNAGPVKPIDGDSRNQTPAPTRYTKEAKI